MKLGIIPAVISPFALAKIGAGHARRYFVTGERFDAETALRIGLVSEVADDLDAAVERVVGELLSAGPHAARWAKRLVRERPGGPGDGALDRRAARERRGAGGPARVSREAARAPGARSDGSTGGARRPWLRRDRRALRALAGRDRRRPAPRVGGRARIAVAGRSARARARLRCRRSRHAAPRRAVPGHRRRRLGRASAPRASRRPGGGVRAGGLHRARARSRVVRRSRLVLRVQPRAARAPRADVRADPRLARRGRSAHDRARRRRHGGLDGRVARSADVLLELPARDEHAAGAGGGLRDPPRRARHVPRARRRRDLPVGARRSGEWDEPRSGRLEGRERGPAARELELLGRRTP